MGRMNRIKSVAGAIPLLLAVAALSTCDNAINLKDSIQVELLKANDRYLKVLDVSIPVDLYNNFNPTGTISISFDRDIDLASLTAQTVVIKDESGARVDYPLKGIEYVSSARLVRVRVYPYLDTDEDFTITVAGVKGSDGSEIYDKPTKPFHTQNILAGSILSIESTDADSDEGVSGVSTVDIDCQVNDRYATLKYKISLDYETADVPAWSALSDPFSYPAGGTFTIGDQDLSTLTGYGDGPLRVTVQFLGYDPGTGYYVEGMSDTVNLYVDTEIPGAGTLSVNSGAAWTNSTAVTLAVSDVSDGSFSSGIPEARFSNDGTNWSGYVPITSSIAWDLLSGAGGSSANGTRTVYAKVRDAAYNESVTVFSDTIGYDNVLPSAGTWLINYGDTTVYQGSVILSASVAPSDATSGVTSMRFSNDGNNWSKWQTLSKEAKWNILDTTYGGNAKDGTKTVYVEVRDAAYNVSAYTTDTIEYSSTAPEIGMPDLVDKYDTGTSSTDNITYSEKGLYYFTVLASDEYKVYLYEDDTKIADYYDYDGKYWYFYEVALDPGTHSIIARTDAGKSEALKLVIDATPPDVPDVDGDASTRTPTWKWSGEEGSAYVYYCKALDADGVYTLDGYVTAPKELADGTYTLEVYQMDVAGNLSEKPGSKDLTIDLPPNAPVVTSAYPSTALTSVVWSWTPGGFGNGSYRYQLDSTDPNYWIETYDTSIKIADLKDGTHTLYVEESDGVEWSSYGKYAVTVGPIAPYHKEENVSTTPLLQWRAQTGATSYTILVQNTRTLLFVEVATVTALKYQVPSALAYSTEVTWKIRVNGTTTSYLPATGAYVFVTGSAP